MERLDVTCDLVGISPIQFSAAIKSKKTAAETHDAFEERTWRERCHTDKDGHVFMPPQALKNALQAVGKYLGESVPGKGKKTYTAYFVSGVMITEPLVIYSGTGKPAKAAEIECNRLHVPSDGRPGGGSRVWKNFPIMQDWSTKATIIVLEKVLIDKSEKIEEYIEHAGKFIGLGMSRPQKNGYFGRWTVKNFKATKVA